MMISFEEALAKIAALRTAKETEQITLDKALGRTLAETLTAQTTLPPANVSAMDGYAVRLADVSQEGTQLRLIGASPAGTPFEGNIAEGQTVRIFTGGQLPAGADHVVPQENTRVTGDTITIIPASTSPRHVRSKGLDFAQGDDLFEAGTTMGPSEVSIAAAANCDRLDVYKRPVVALLANGDELKPVGSHLERGEIINSNPYALAALISNWGGTPLNLGIASDSIASIHEHLALAATADIIVPVGGASVGDHDHMFAAFEQLGFSPVFRKVAVKPGKPTWCAAKDGQTVLGLPGNPASALVCAHLFLKPLIMGKQLHQFSVAKLATPLPASGQRAEFLRSTCEIDENGQLWVSPLSNQDSSLLHPFLAANTLLYRAPTDPAYERSDLVKILPIAPVVR
ncbi:MAG: molybdopterin molybdotransferase MoeA [Hyphomonadaceae bacterium]